MNRNSTISDHPVIRNMERFGTPDGKEERFPVCPECGAEADTFYRNRDRDIVGCDQCINFVDALEVAAEME